MDFRDWLREKLETDPDFAAEWERQAPERLAETVRIAGDIERRIMLAAPDLLAALEAVWAQIPECNGCISFEECWPMKGQVEAALAKARGE